MAPCLCVLMPSLGVGYVYVAQRDDRKPMLLYDKLSSTLVVKHETAKTPYHIIHVPAEVTQVAVPEAPTVSAGVAAYRFRFVQFSVEYEEPVAQPWIQIPKHDTCVRCRNCKRSVFPREKQFLPMYQLPSVRWYEIAEFVNCSESEEARVASTVPTCEGKVMFSLAATLAHLDDIDPSAIITEPLDKTTTKASCAACNTFLATSIARDDRELRFDSSAIQLQSQRFPDAPATVSASQAIRSDLYMRLTGLGNSKFLLTNLSQLDEANPLFVVLWFPSSNITLLDLQVSKPTEYNAKGWLKSLRVLYEHSLWSTTETTELGRVWSGDAAVTQFAVSEEALLGLIKLLEKWHRYTPPSGRAVQGLKASFMPLA
eukprot:m.72292 g.72292  ORF g.72292 m.72292 type:complete len:371 (+) comp12328_c0_seq3:90-1202(+)